MATDPNVLSDPSIESFLLGISPLGIPGTPTAPVYDYHSVNDEYAPIGPDRQLMHRFCAAGVPVDHVETLGTEHDTEVYTGESGVLNFLAARFAGDTPVNTCATIPEHRSTPCPSQPRRLRAQPPNAGARAASRCASAASTTSTSPATAGPSACATTATRLTRPSPSAPTPEPSRSA
jgi:hypothetical protein